MGARIPANNNNLVLRLRSNNCLIMNLKKKSNKQASVSIVGRLSIQNKKLGSTALPT